MKEITLDSDCINHSFEEMTTLFNNFTDLKNFILEQTGCAAFPGEGINVRLEQRAVILRSVDGTYYYDDDLSNPETVWYTMFGQVGDQTLLERRNRYFCRDAEHIYLYRKTSTGKYIWYGEYEIKGVESKYWDDINRNERIIHRIKLRRIHQVAENI